jgi:hypothetical protein
MSKEDSLTEPTIERRAMEEEDKLRSSSSEEVSPPATAHHSVLDDTTTTDEKTVHSTAGEDNTVNEQTGEDVPATPTDQIVYPGIITKLGVGLGLSLAIFLVPPSNLKHPPIPKPCSDPNNARLGIIGPDDCRDSHPHYLGLL